MGVRSCKIFVEVEVGEGKVRTFYFLFNNVGSKLAGIHNHLNKNQSMARTSQKVDTRNEININTFIC